MPEARNATPMEWRFSFSALVTGLRPKLRALAVSIALDCRLPGWLLPFEGRSLAVARAGRPVLLWPPEIHSATDTSLALL